MILDQIVNQKKIDLQTQRKRLSLEEIKEGIDQAKPTRSFFSALQSTDKSTSIPKVIAEIKKASPSKGIIREDFNPTEIARIYEGNGASAISVLTEERFFLGSLDYLQAVKNQTKSLPILRKDFIFNSYQIYESRYYGADAILLIAELLSKQQIEEFLEEARQLDMDCLLEVHDHYELEKALLTKAKIIGINNRDLKTFKVDIQITLNLLPDIPKGHVIVSESAIKSHSDLILLGKAGVDAVLVGEALMASKDVGQVLRELIGIED